MENVSSDTRKSALAIARKHADLLSLCGERQGQIGPTRGPASGPGTVRPNNAYSPLGPPMNIRQVAQLIGCSVWSVRQRHISQGLPHFRSSPSGKLIFYHDQVVRWILENQIQERRTNWR